MRTDEFRATVVDHVVVTVGTMGWAWGRLDNRSKDLSRYTATGIIWVFWNMISLFLQCEHCKQLLLSILLLLISDHEINDWTNPFSSSEHRQQESVHAASSESRQIKMQTLCVIEQRDLYLNNHKGTRQRSLCSLFHRCSLLCQFSASVETKTSKEAQGAG